MLCRLMQWDFMEGTGRYDEDGAELYSVRDLEYGAQYASDYLAEGITKEPMMGFDLEQFREWCNAQSQRDHMH